MTPSEFMDDYRELGVLDEDGWALLVDVHAYMINQPGNHSCDKALATWYKVRHALDRQLKKSLPMHSGQLVHAPLTDGPLDGPRGYHVPANRHELRDALLELHHYERELLLVPYGKGSPSQVSRYLTLAIKAGVVDDAGLQAFADARNVGLDCSGFVSNYLVAIGKMDASEVDDHNAHSYASGHPKRTTIESLKNLDILVWADGHHVAIMEGPTTTKPQNVTTATVVESNGARGLDNETYTFVSVDAHGLFKVKRANGSIHHVHIFDWKLS